MNKDKIVIFRSYIDTIAELPAELYKEASQALFAYILEKKEPGDDTTPLVRAIFVSLKAQVDSNTERYERCVRNGRKGGAPKGNRNNPNGRRGKGNNQEPTHIQPTSNLHPTYNQPTTNQLPTHIQPTTNQEPDLKPTNKQPTTNQEQTRNRPRTNQDSEKAKLAQIAKNQDVDELTEINQNKPEQNLYDNMIYDIYRELNIKFNSFVFARHGHNLTGASPERALIVGSA